MAEYRLSPAAQRDLDGIFNYTFQQWGTAQAIHYIDILEAACVKLVEIPSQGQDCSYIRPGYRRRHVERHIVYYRIEPFGVAIIRILHYRQNVLRHL
ncbi:MAG: Toxin ParE1 [Nitrosomonas europaea]|uniref:type II toxin-antitoxin system RelE/ParE family toxin n=1 Tax=Nitrosomonas TaxID=914 RepID=UPI0023F15D66|nr:MULTISPECIES: type II toxin-antitoxin system RelE/ParE family toxin [Nitrosomonas]MBV6388535.1 Toxin ParE1 [Nitrosomonas europaea]MCE7916966.1 type II toxin-antitoxin system RelE/ParE family toxin [Nitrosomonas sp. PRO5]